MLTDPPEIFARIYARHGHRCPMSTLGGRLGMAAMKLFGAGEGELKAVYSNRTCALDGISETTGCSEEAGNLTVKNDGRHSLQLQTSEAVIEVELTELAMEMAGRYRMLCNRLEQGWESLDEDEKARRQVEMEAMLDELLPQFWLMPDEELVIKIS